MIPFYIRIKHEQYVSFKLFISGLLSSHKNIDCPSQKNLSSGQTVFFTNVAN